MQNTLTGKTGDVIALLGGLLFPLAFAPFFLFPLSILCLAALFITWSCASPGRVAWRAFLFGFGMFSVGVSWIYVSLHTFGNMPMMLAAVSVAGLIALLSLFPAVGAYVQARIARGHSITAMTLLMPAGWMLAEWLRDWVLTGFPWLSAGYSQVNSWLGHFAPWVGVYGVSLVVALCAGLLTAIVLNPRKFAAKGVLMIIFIFTLAWAADRVQWSTAEGEPLRVALVQGNIPLIAKWQPDESLRIRDLYLQTSLTLPDRDLIVWPESALPFFVDEVGDEFWQELRKHPADFIFGLLEREPGGTPYYNSVVAVSDELEFYRKKHLVPFGEFLPFKPLFSWVIGRLEIPMADFTSWQAPQPALTAAGQQASISVCYEDAFPLGVRTALPQATLLVNVSEDAWFGDSLAPHQRLQIAQMRAMETARPFVRAANTGVSAVIDPRGKIVTQTPQFQFAVLQSHVQPMSGATPFVRFGNYPMLILMVVLAVAGTLSTRRFEKKSEVGAIRGGS